jgi:hypothetical protein
MEEINMEYSFNALRSYQKGKKKLYVVTVGEHGTMKCLWSQKQQAIKEAKNIKKYWLDSNAMILQKYGEKAKTMTFDTLFVYRCPWNKESEWYMSESESLFSI